MKYPGWQRVKHSVPGSVWKPFHFCHDTDLSSIGHHARQDSYLTRHLDLTNDKSELWGSDLPLVRPVASRQLKLRAYGTAWLCGVRTGPNPPNHPTPGARTKIQSDLNCLSWLRWLVGPLGYRAPVICSLISARTLQNDRPSALPCPLPLHKVVKAVFTLYVSLGLARPPLAERTVEILAGEYLVHSRVRLYSKAAANTQNIFTRWMGSEHAKTHTNQVPEQNRADKNGRQDTHHMPGGTHTELPTAPKAR